MFTTAHCEKFDSESNQILSKLKQGLALFWQISRPARLCIFEIKDLDKKEHQSCQIHIHAMLYYFGPRGSTGMSRWSMIISDSEQSWEIYMTNTEIPKCTFTRSTLNPRSRILSQIGFHESPSVKVSPTEMKCGNQAWDHLSSTSNPKARN